MDLVAIHITVEDQLILRGPLERETCLPLFAVTFRERDRALVNINRSAVPGKGVVHALKGDALGQVEDYTTPAAVVVVENGWAEFPVNPKLVHIPYSVKRRSRPV